MKFKTYEEDILNIFPFYLRTIAINYHQEHVVRNSGYDFHQLFMVKNGKGIIKIDGKTYNLNEGDLFFILKDTPHEYYGLTDDFITLFLSFSATDFEKFKNYYNIKNYGIYTKKDCTTFKTHIETLFNNLETEISISHICAKTFLAIVSFFDNLKEKNEIEKIYTFIENNYQKPLRLDDILSIYPYSKSKLCRNFKEKYNMSIFDMLTKIRLENAYYLIKTNPYLKLDYVSSLCGFNDTSYFCKMYKRKFNISPKKMIKEL